MKRSNCEERSRPAKGKRARAQMAEHDVENEAAAIVKSKQFNRRIRDVADWWQKTGGVEEAANKFSLSVTISRSAETHVSGSRFR
jgi:hypothetical protein